MKQFILYIAIFVLLITCNRAEINLKLIQGSWVVVSLSKHPLTISGYENGILDLKSVLDFGNDGNLKIYQSNSPANLETFKYTVEGNHVVIYYSDFGIPFEIKDLGNGQIELFATGYGETKEARKEIRRIILSKKEK